jgi:hypothetical protein
MFTLPLVTRWGIFDGYGYPVITDSGDFQIEPVQQGDGFDDPCTKNEKYRLYAVSLDQDKRIESPAACLPYFITGKKAPAGNAPKREGCKFLYVYPCLTAGFLTQTRRHVSILLLPILFSRDTCAGAI